MYSKPLLQARALLISIALALAPFPTHAEYATGVIRDMAITSDGVYVSLNGEVSFPSVSCQQNASEALRVTGTTNDNTRAPYHTVADNTGGRLDVLQIRARFITGKASPITQ